MRSNNQGSKFAKLLSQRHVPSDHVSRAVLVVVVDVCSFPRVLAEIKQQYMSLSTKKECKLSVNQTSWLKKSLSVICNLAQEGPAVDVSE